MIDARSTPREVNIVIEIHDRPAIGPSPPCTRDADHIHAVFLVHDQGQSDEQRTMDEADISKRSRSGMITAAGYALDGPSNANTTDVEKKNVRDGNQCSHRDPCDHHERTEPDEGWVIGQSIAK